MLQSTNGGPVSRDGRRGLQRLAPRRAAPRARRARPGARQLLDGHAGEPALRARGGSPARGDPRRHQEPRRGGARGARRPRHLPPGGDAVGAALREGSARRQREQRDRDAQRARGGATRARRPRRVRVVVVGVRRPPRPPQARGAAAGADLAVRGVEGGGRAVRGRVDAPLRRRDDRAPLLQRLRPASGSEVRVRRGDPAVHPLGPPRPAPRGPRRRRPVAGLYVHRQRRRGQPARRARRGRRRRGLQRRLREPGEPARDHREARDDPRTAPPAPARAAAPWRRGSHARGRVEGQAAVVFYNVQEALVKVDRHGKLVPWLAERWHTTDNRNYTFFLKRGVHFHNGRELVAADVKYVFERAMNPETKHPYPGYYAAIGDIIVRDDHTITFSLKSLNANFLLNLARQGPVLSQRDAVD